VFDSGQTFEVQEPVSAHVIIWTVGQTLRSQFSSYSLWSGPGIRWYDVKVVW